MSNTYISLINSPTEIVILWEESQKEDRDHFGNDGLFSWRADVLIYPYNAITNIFFVDGHAIKSGKIDDNTIKAMNNIFGLPGTSDYLIEPTN